MTNYFDQLNRVKGTKFNWSFSLTNSQLVKMTNFKKVATKKYGCFNQSVFTVYDYSRNSFHARVVHLTIIVDDYSNLKKQQPLKLRTNYCKRMSKSVILVYSLCRCQRFA